MHAQLACALLSPTYSLSLPSALCARCLNGMVLLIPIQGLGLRKSKNIKGQVEGKLEDCVMLKMRARNTREPGY